jgi:hypothetical protein
LLSLPWLNQDAVFVFRCPHDLPVWEAAPLLELGLGPLSEELRASGTTVLAACARAALKVSSRVAFVAAHEWYKDDRIRFESGTLGEFLEFVAAPEAWATMYLGRGNAYLASPDSDLPFLFEVRR